MKKLFDGSFVSSDTPTKNVSGIRYLLSPEEIVEQNKAEAAEIMSRPLREWEAKMAATDAHIPRALEDVIEGLTRALAAAGVTLSAHLPDTTYNKYVEKKQLRTEKPRS